MTEPGAFHSAWITSDGQVSGEGAFTEIFPWWSFTKTALAVAVLKLVEKGALQLDAPLPDKPYTLRQLLLHVAGVPDYGALAGYHEAVAKGEGAWPRERLLREAQAERLAFSPGTDFLYSNIGYMFVGDIIASATGLSVAAALEALVTAPLSLASVSFATKRADLARTFWPALRLYDPAWVYHGLLVGSPVDAARLLSAVLTGNFLERTSVAAMFNRQIKLSGPGTSGLPRTERGYALGLMLGREEPAGRVAGHSGGGPVGSSAVYHYPDLPRPVTVATFTLIDPPAGENEARRIALACQ